MQPIDKIYPKQSSICTCMNIRRASRAVTQFYDEALKPCCLTIAQLSLLKNLATAKSVTISDLAKRMRIDRTTLNRNMKPLVDNGLLFISPGKDSRTRQVTLTESGIAACNEAWRLWEEAQASLREYLGEEDSTRLVQLLSRLEAIMP
jgi:DNA-binding MarR family transcriptional regulator